MPRKCPRGTDSCEEADHLLAGFLSTGGLSSHELCGTQLLATDPRGESLGIIGSLFLELGGELTELGFLLHVGNAVVLIQSTMHQSSDSISVCEASHGTRDPLR